MLTAAAAVAAATSEKTCRWRRLTNTPWLMMMGVNCTYRRAVAVHTSWHTTQRRQCYSTGLAVAHSDSDGLLLAQL